MPRGGWRPGGGRPTKEAAAAKAKQLAETIAKGVKISPRAYLEGVLASPGSTKSEKMRAAELLLKLPPEAPASSDSPPVEFKILCCPRGSHVHSDGKVYMYPEGEPLEFVEGLFEPFEATPPFSATPRRAREPEPALKEAIEPEPVSFEAPEPVPPSNVQPLRPYERGLTFGVRDDPSRRPEAMDPFRFKPRD